MEQKQGKLKIFLGYAAGVGKTYAMLEAAQSLRKAGVDVVAGYIEPHQRPETIQKSEGLESIEPLIISYKGIQIKEFDLEAALSRHPEVILVDELAHTNVQGMRHRKRYQDIEELLRNGINVYTTVNIQHIESLNDVVEQITGVVVKERIPDHVFEDADTVELIDISPSELMLRLNQGKIYKDIQAQRALSNFFLEENLIALREIALRKTADQINQRNYLPSSSFTKEHILVCISDSPTSDKVIRTAARMADAFHAQFTAVYVEFEEIDSVRDKSVKENLRLAEELGAQLTTLYGDDIANQIAEYAKISHVSKIVIGKSSKKRVRFGQLSIIDQLAEYAPNIDIHVIPDSSTVYYEKRSNILGKETFRLRDGLKVFAMLSIATAIGYFFFELGFTEANIIIVFILGVLITSLITDGRIWSIISSVLAVLVFNFFFADPRFTFAAYDSGYPFTFLFMFATAFITSTLTTKLKQRSIDSAKKTYRTDILLETSLKLQGANTKAEIIAAIGNQIKKLVNENVIIYTFEDSQLVPMVFVDATQEYVHDILLSQQERAIAEWVYENNKRAGAQTNTLSNAVCTYLAVRSSDKVVAVVAVELHDPLEAFEKNLLVSLINEGGLALEKAILNEEQKESTLSLEQEKLRSNILRTISHDLRTPLTSISGNADLLIKNPELESTQRLNLYEGIHKDAVWLIDLVENLLAVTRIDNSKTMLHFEGEVLEDLIQESIDRVQSKLGNRTLEYKTSEVIDTVSVDSKLIIQVFTNVLDNAIKYTPADAKIKISTRSKKDTVSVIIEDNGPGIKDKSQLFDMFYTEKQDSRRGMGLGLYLVHEIVKAHGGKVKVNDVTPHGVSFEISLRRYVVDESKNLNH
ncbi:sensor histidine kinase KdpD [Erysipelothrix sp. HDW6A]|uniref:sensor histidine kinase n=1 Tax=Erysipelothrix sp. HDW6A TaxID=2714928 RepID=UPI00140C86F7|nr:sensor histidine kinase KdpD [Erysipelothrix sp. HDW6A]QIK57924.1 sensor histidine kinase KdpD [Erysipelothrix sp. HDW6A]